MTAIIGLPTPVPQSEYICIIFYFTLRFFIGSLMMVVMDRNMQLCLSTKKKLDGKKRRSLLYTLWSPSLLFF